MNVLVFHLHQPNWMRRGDGRTLPLTWRRVPKDHFTCCTTFEPQPRWTVRTSSRSKWLAPSDTRWTATPYPTLPLDIPPVLSVAYVPTRGYPGNVWCVTECATSLFSICVPGQRAPSDVWPPEARVGGAWWQHMGASVQWNVREDVSKGN